MKLKEIISHIMHDKRAQGGIVSFFIGAMIAVIIAMQVTWPVIDNALTAGLTDPTNDSITGSILENMSGPTQTLVLLLPLFLILTLVMVFIRPLM